MAILFTVSLLLLVVFFSVKIWEIRSGKRMFMNETRLRADRMVKKAAGSASSSVKSGGRKIKFYTASLVKQIRNALSSWLEQAARRIRQ